LSVTGKPNSVLKRIDEPWQARRSIASWTYNRYVGVCCWLLLLLYCFGAQCDLGLMRHICLASMVVWRRWIGSRKLRRDEHPRDRVRVSWILIHRVPSHAAEAHNPSLVQHPLPDRLPMRLGSRRRPWPRSLIPPLGSTYVTAIRPNHLRASACPHTFQR
jgi:hypothetical protein